MGSCFEIDGHSFCRTVIQSSWQLQWNHPRNQPQKINIYSNIFKIVVMIVPAVYIQYKNCKAGLLRMQLLGRMNAKMDEGYKLTNFYCTFCNGVTLAKPSNLNVEGSVFCPKCNKEYVPVREDQDDEDQDDIHYQQCMKQSKFAQKPLQSQQTPEKFQSLQPEPPLQPQYDEQQDPAQAQYRQFLSLYNSTVKTAQQTKSEQVSKKMGQKLIAGWAMLEEACQQCNVPLMKSKKGNMVCCGCDRDYMKETSSKTPKANQKRQVKEHVAPSQAKKQQSRVSKVEEKQPQKPTLTKPSQEKQQKQISQLHQESNHTHQHRHLAQDKIAELSYKTLQFLEKRLDQAFSLNDLESVDRVLRSIKTVKELL